MYPPPPSPSPPPSHARRDITLEVGHLPPYDRQRLTPLQDRRLDDDDDGSCKPLLRQLAVPNKGRPSRVLFLKIIIYIFVVVFTTAVKKRPVVCVSFVFLVLLLILYITCLTCAHSNRKLHRIVRLMLGIIILLCYHIILHLGESFELSYNIMATIIIIDCSPLLLSIGRTRR